MPAEYRHLQAFVAVASTGSMSRAAAQLGYSQPAITQQVRHLEQVLGTLLFERDCIPLRLTSAGRERLAIARAVISLHRELVGASTPPATRARPIQTPDTSCR